MAEEAYEEFLRWLEAIGGVCKGGLEKLEKSAISSVRACLTLDDINEIWLAIGDRGIFRAGWSELVSPSQSPGPGPGPGPDTKDPPSYDDSDPDLKQYSISDITKFFGTPGAQGLTPGQQLKSVLPHQQSSVITPRHPEPVTTKTLAKDKLLNRLAVEYAQEGIKDTLSLQELALGLTKGEKVLLPINFATVFVGCAVEEEEIVGCGQFAGRLVWQAGRGNSKRPSADKLTYGQFF
jgi:hypothetical protein